MSDAIQIVIVTAVAGVALIALVRPYLRRTDPKKAVPPCANCAASGTPHTARTTTPSPSTHH
jgi:hypothetical protein